MSLSHNPSPCNARRGCAGKTTFIQNMFAAYAQNPSLSVNDASAPTAKEDFVSDPEKLCTEIVVRDQQNQVAFHYRVQDSPGELCLEVVVEDPSSDTHTHTGGRTRLIQDYIYRAEAESL